MGTKEVKTKNDTRGNADNLKIVSFSIAAFYQNARSAKKGIGDFPKM
ncbi:hypothetical protein [uncultured Streptococcus sp.]|nr:hypothetical protein [uncultured Streptococcus sp.]